MSELSLHRPRLRIFGGPLSMRSSRSFSLWLLLWLIPLGSLRAHPFHISTAEVDYNAETRRLEVGLKLHAVDTERALTRLAGRKVNVEKNGVVTKLLTRYLAENFYITGKTNLVEIAGRDAGDTAGTASDVPAPTSAPEAAPAPANRVLVNQAMRSKVHFVGKELETTWLWLYFELEVEENQGELVLVNSVLLDLTEDQINTVSVRYAGRRHALKTSAKQPWVEFPREWLHRAPEPPSR